MVNKRIRYERLASCAVVFPGTEEMYFKVAVTLLDYQFLVKEHCLGFIPPARFLSPDPALPQGETAISPFTLRPL